MWFCNLNLKEIGKILTLLKDIISANREWYNKFLWHVLCVGEDLNDCMWWENDISTKSIFDEYIQRKIQLLMYDKECLNIFNMGP